MGTSAVVVLNWNGSAWLRRFLPSVVRHSPGARIVLADNGSTDGSTDWVAGALPDVEILRLGSNLGFAGGYNAALAQLETDYFVLLNSDVDVRQGWLEGLRDLLERNPDMAACQPKVLAQRAPSRFEHAGAAGGYIDRNGYPFCRGRIFELTEEDHGQYDDERDVFWATGACFIVRREAFREVGGFDATLFAHMEEIDLCWRLRRRGWRIGYTSASVVYHVGGGSLGYGSPRKTYLNFRNSLIVLTKNLRDPNVTYRIFRRVILDGFAAWKFLLEGHAAHAWQVARAHTHFLHRLPALLRERERLIKEENNPDLTGTYRRSIAYDRFILGQEKFSDLDPTAFVRHGDHAPDPRSR